MPPEFRALGITSILYRPGESGDRYSQYTVNKTFYPEIPGPGSGGDIVIVIRGR